MLYLPQASASGWQVAGRGQKNCRDESRVGVHVDYSYEISLGLKEDEDSLKFEVAIPVSYSLQVTVIDLYGYFEL